MKIDTLQPVIVGYGRAGRGLHHQSLRALARRGVAPRGDVLVVDTRPPMSPMRGARWFPTVGAAVQALPEVSRGVFHVTVPVAEHVPVLHELLDLGCSQIVIEKPLARTSQEARQITERAAARAALLPVSLWPASDVTQRVVELLAAGRIGRPLSFHMEQSKPRFRRSRTDSGHQSAFEVELPHQVLLALYLCGPVAEISQVVTWDMPDDLTTRTAMGGVWMRMTHRGGMVSTLVSDLTSPIRIRRLRIRGTSGELIADYPISSDDDFGQIRLTGTPGRKVVPDAPLCRFLERAYAHLGDGSPAPECGLATHLEAIHVLETAQARCDLAKGGVRYAAG